jgi:hypothetical protein
MMISDDEEVMLCWIGALCWFGGGVGSFQNT